MTAHEQHQPYNSIALKILQSVIKVLGQLNPNLAAYYVYHLWHKTQRYRPPERERQWQQVARLQRLEAVGEKLAVYEWGQGPNVLLLHGWSGRGMQMGAIAQGLGDAGYRAIAIDFPAHGKSPGKKTNAYTMAEAVQCVAAHYGEIHSLVSHSFGILPLVMAMRDGLVTQHIVAICPPDSMPPLFDIFCNSLGLTHQTKEILCQLTEKNYGEHVWEDVSPCFNVKNLHQGALIIHDENDKELSWQRGKALADSWPNSIFTLTQGLGHRRILRDAAVIEKITHYINQRDY